MTNKKIKTLTVEEIKTELKNRSLIDVFNKKQCDLFLNRMLEFDDSILKEFISLFIDSMYWSKDEDTVDYKISEYIEKYNKRINNIIIGIYEEELKLYIR